MFKPAVDLLDLGLHTQYLWYNADDPNITKYADI